jgi:hypothetical protein
VYLTVYNAAKAELRPTVTVELDELRLSGRTCCASDILSGGTWSAAVEAERATLEVDVAAETVRVLRVEAH